MSEERNRKGDELRWLSGFAVFGSLLALPGLLPVVNNLNLDADPSRAGLRFFSFDAGFLLASGLSQSLLRKFGVRPTAAAGPCIASGCLVALVFVSPVLPLGWQLAPFVGLGLAGGLVSIACLFALKPWSSRLGARALPRAAEFTAVGCIFSCVATAIAYGWGRGRISPVPVCAAAALYLVYALSGRPPLAVVEKRAASRDSNVRQHRSIASFLLLALLFVQVGSEWSVAGWLPLFLIHRIGAAPEIAICVLAFFFIALLSGRVLAQRVIGKLGSRALLSCGAVLALIGCLILTVSETLVGISVGLTALAIGFAPPYSVIKNVLDEGLHFPPGFYQAVLSVAITGAMCAPWLVGYAHELLGIGALSLFPAAGSLIVLVLELLLVFEAHLMGERAPARQSLPSVDRRTY